MHQPRVARPRCKWGPKSGNRQRRRRLPAAREALDSPLVVSTPPTAKPARQQSFRWGGRLRKRDDEQLQPAYRWRYLVGL